MLVLSPAVRTPTEDFDESERTHVHRIAVVADVNIDVVGYVVAADGTANVRLVIAVNPHVSPVETERFERFLLFPQIVQLRDCQHVEHGFPG
ncbi:MAG TPA: hypothetical protein VF329_06520 [Gammaproteobacteria bacterium]